MKKIKGDIFKLQEVNPSSFIVIPTNLGYTKDEMNVMGRGLAYAVKNKHVDELLMSLNKNIL